MCWSRWTERRTAVRRWGEPLFHNIQTSPASFLFPNKRFSLYVVSSQCSSVQGWPRHAPPLPHQVMPQCELAVALTVSLCQVSGQHISQRHSGRASSRWNFCPKLETRDRDDTKNDNHGIIWLCTFRWENSVKPVDKLGI